MEQRAVLRSVEEDDFHARHAHGMALAKNGRAKDADKEWEIARQLAESQLAEAEAPDAAALLQFRDERVLPCFFPLPPQGQRPQTALASPHRFRRSLPTPPMAQRARNRWLGALWRSNMRAPLLFKKII